ncbi:MAG: hypothetical protein ABIR19_01920 [Ginsengibacter sp.]
MTNTKLSKIARDFSFLILASALFVSCQKEKAPEPTPETQLTKTETLVKNQWELDEVYRSIQGSNSHYQRNGENNTGVHYDYIHFTFNTDGTGEYIDEVNTHHPVNWTFISSDFRNINLEIGAPYATSFDWHLVEITKDALHNTTTVGSDILVSARYFPVPRSFPDK